MVIASKLTHQPFEVLPNELLAEICVHWADIDEDAALMAASINRRWRLVVLSSPAVWSRVWIHFRQPVEQEDENWCIEEDVDQVHGVPRPLPLWLQRSGKEPIHLSIVTEAIPLTAEELNNLVFMLIPFVARLEVVTLSTESSLIAESLLDMLWAHAPMLNHLSIICRRMRGVLQAREKGTIDTLWVALHRARSIKSLTCEGCIPPKLDDSIPHTGLTRLIVQDFSGEMVQFLDALESCQDLEELSVLKCQFPNMGVLGAPNRVVVLQKVSTVQMQGVSSPQMLEHLRTPKLRSLDLQSVFSLTDLTVTLDIGGMKAVSTEMREFADVLAKFLGYGNQLYDLHMEWSSIPDKSFIQILAVCPNLRHFHLQESFVSHKLMAGLARRVEGTKDPILCPMLEGVILIACSLLSGQSLIELIRSRNTGPVRIRYLTIRNCELVSSDNIATLRSIDNALRVDYH